MTPAPIYGLVCAGGGAHGAYQVGVLKYIHEHFCVGEASPFRIFSGTSAGSLSTAFYASRSYDARTSRLDLEGMWLDFHVPAYHGNIIKSAIRRFLKEWATPQALRKTSWSLLDPAPLYDIVVEGFQRKSLERAKEEGTTLGLAVSTTEFRSSRLVWWQEGAGAASWHTPASTSFATGVDTLHVQASCSVPIVFPPVLIDGRYFSDGGVANKHPLSPAVNMGATRILCIATDQPLPSSLPEYPTDFEPSLKETIQMVLDQVGHDYAADQSAQLQIMNYFFESLAADERQSAQHQLLRGQDIRLDAYQPVETELFAPSRRIRHTDIFSPEEFDEELESRQTSLLFQRDFIRELIEFGYEDARSRHTRLEGFFDRDRPQRPSKLSESSWPLNWL